MDFYIVVRRVLEKSDLAPKELHISLRPMNSMNDEKVFLSAKHPPIHFF